MALGSEHRGWAYSQGGPASVSFPDGGIPFQGGCLSAVSCWMGGEHVYAPHYNPTTPHGEPCLAGPPPYQVSLET